MEYYPPITDLLVPSHIPDFFQGIDGGLNQLFGNIRIKELQIDNSPFSTGVNAYAVLRTSQRVEMGLLGTALKLIFNPTLSTQTIGAYTDIPLSLSFRLPIQDYIRNFQIQGFSAAPEAFFELIRNVFVVDDEVVASAIVRHLIPSQLVQDLMDDINAAVTLSPALSSPLIGVIENDVATLASEIDSHPGLNASGRDLLDLLLDTYLLNQNPPYPREDFLEASFKPYFDSDVIELVKSYFVPQIDLRVGLSAGIEFPREYLIPVDTNGEVVSNPNIKLVLLLNAGEFRFNTHGKIGFTAPITVTFPPQYPTAQIGNTWLRIGFLNAQLDLSRDKNIPQAIADGRPNDFIGVYIDQATISFPKFWQQDPNGPPSTAQIVGRKLLIGTGGFSGTIALEGSNQGDLFHTRLNNPNGFAIGLHAFEVKFHQNAIVGSTIKGWLTIPGLEDKNNPGHPAKIELDVSIGNDTFELTARSQQGIVLSIPNVFDITIHSLSIGRGPDPNDPGNYRFHLALSGDLKITTTSPGSSTPILDSNIHVQKLIIYDDGSYEFVGGVNLLPRAITLLLGPAKVTVTALSFGSHEQLHDSGTGPVLRKYAFFGFDGGLAVHPGGVDVRGDGVKLYFTTDNGPGMPLHVFFRIEGIYIDLVIPGNATPETAALLIHGYLAMRNPDPGSGAALAGDPATEYMGGIDFAIPKAKIRGSAGMRLIPSLPAFIIDIGLELTMPIPLGPSGLGIYGFRGIVGNHYLPSKTAAGLAPPDESHPWWEYYKAKPTPPGTEGVNLRKFSPDEPGFSLGAGVSLATAGDSGKVFSSKLFFLLGLPDVFLLQGQAAVLKQRIGLDDTNDPPFSAMIAITHDRVEAGFGVSMSVPAATGKVLRLEGAVEMAFFFQNAGAWFVNFGKDEPINKRIQARILDLFNGYAYLMLSGSGMKQGAGVSWEFKKDYANGTVKLELGAALEEAMQLSWGPPPQNPAGRQQSAGHVSLSGYARVKVFCFKLGFGASATLSAEAPKPFSVTGKFKLWIELPKPIDDIELNVELSWVFDPNDDTSEVKVIDMESVANRAPFQAIHRLTKDAFALNYLPSDTLGLIDPPTSSNWAGSFDDYIVPMDSRIDVEFAKPVKPFTQRYGGVTTGYQNIERNAPKKARLAQVKHEYSVEDVSILYWDDGSNRWLPYDVYAACTPLSDVALVNPSVFNSSPLGYWQLSEPERYTKLSIMSQTPFSYMTAGSPSVVIPEQWGFGASNILCAGLGVGKTCTDWEGVNLNTVYTSGSNVVHGGLVFRMLYGDGLIGSVPNIWILHYGLQIPRGAQLEVIFPTPMSVVDLRLTTMTPSLRVEYYQRVEVVQAVPPPVPVYNWVLVQSTNYQQWNELFDVIHYEDGAQPIDKVVIVPGGCSVDTHAELSYLQDFCHYLTGLIDNLPVDIDALRQQLDIAIQDCDNANANQNPNAATICAQVAVVQAELNRLRTQLDLAIAAQGTYCRAIEREPIPTACATWLHKICVLSQADYAYNLTLPSQATITGSVTEMVNSINRVIEPVWRPNTRFAIQVKTKDLVHRDLALFGSPGGYERYYTFGFRTAGPMGFFHQYKDGNGQDQVRTDYAALAAAKREEEYRLATLKQYADVERSFPDPTGKIMNAKPLFFDAPRLSLFFLRQYAYAMYSNWDVMGTLGAENILLRVKVKDPRELASGGITPPATTNVYYAPTNNVPVPLEVQILNNLLAGGVNCTGVVGPALPPGMLGVAKLPRLEPLKLYTALWESEMNGESKEVLRYGFQTSRYADFLAQVRSYVLHDDGQGGFTYAVFDVPTALGLTDVGLITGILNSSQGTPFDALQRDYMLGYDRVVQGVFGMKALQAAVTTEFNVIVNTHDTNFPPTRPAILIRNPEPFGDPRMPANVQQKIVQVLTGPGGNPDSNYTVLLAKDNASVLVVHNGLDITATSLTLKFSYLEWDGAAYLVKNTATDQLEITIDLQ